MIVKQIYADWLGVVIDGYCVNASIVFAITSDGMARQLIPYKPTEAELEKLLKSMKTGDPSPIRTKAIQSLRQMA